MSAEPSGETVTPLYGADDPDIGRCDDCGTVEGPRVRTVLRARVAGAPARVVAWLCAPCRAERRSTGSAS